jgi:IS5 family transposase
MRSKKKPKNQLSFLAPTLREQLNPDHPLYLLAHKIEWSYFEEEFKIYYSKTGRPAHPIRLMVSLLILKSVYNLSDEKLVEEHWEMNAYFQYFSGFNQTQWGQPCAASDLVYFRQRIGEDGIEKILKHSIDIHDGDGEDRHVSIDTTVQEKNITYPTDAKLYKKIIDKCVAEAANQGIKLRRSYKRTAKLLKRQTYNGMHPRRKKLARKSLKKLKTIAGRLIRELERKLPQGLFEVELELFKRALLQQRNSKNKIYSLHEPEVVCIAEGKAHKKYEYGCKASIVLTQKTGIIVGAKTFMTNIHDSKTIKPVLSQIERLVGKLPKTASVDRGYRGAQGIEEIEIILPKPARKTDIEYQKRKKRKHCKKRAVIEPVIVHLKHDHRVARNYLKGQIGDAINFIMGAAGFNFRKWMRKVKNQAFLSILRALSVFKDIISTYFFSPRPV